MFNKIVAVLFVCGLICFIGLNAMEQPIEPDTESMNKKISEAELSIDELNAHKMM